MLILNKDQITESVSILDVLEAIEESFILQETNDYNMPDRMHVERAGNVLLLMPAFAGDFFSTKLASVFPNNKNENLPAIYASVILNDGKTGKPIAFMDGSVITGLRTGAIGGLAIAYTSPKDVSVIGLIGAGYQGFHQVLFAASVRNIQIVNIYDPYLKNPDQFINKLRSFLPHVSFQMKSNVYDLISDSELVITATSSMEPVIPSDKRLIENKHFIGIGSFKPEMREYPDELFELIDTAIIDTDLACRESGDLSIPLNKNLIERDQIFRLGQVMKGEINIDTSGTTFFKSVGMALFDLLTAKMIYEKALEKGLGLEVEF